MNEINSSGKAFLTLGEAVAETGIPESAFRRAVYDRRLAVTRIGTSRGHIRVARDDLRAFLQSCRVPARGERTARITAV